MKKFIIILTLILMFSLCSCGNKNDINEVQESLTACRTPAYTNDNITEFISDWKQAQVTQNSNNGLYELNSLNNTSENDAALIVPVIQSQDFSLKLIQVFGTNTLYFYIPIEDDRILCSNTIGITIYNNKNVYREITESSFYKFRFFNDGSIAYDTYQNAWIFNNNYVSIAIVFPEDIVLSSPEELSEYFTFETYTAGGGNNHVVS